MEKESTNLSRKATLTIGDQPIYLTEDWNKGIGGGLWSTGLAIAKYVSQHSDHVRHNLRNLSHRKQLDTEADESTKLAEHPRLSLLELGSGNGFLSMCFLALKKGSERKSNEVDDSIFDYVAITDTKEHLPLIETTLQVNQHLVPSLSNSNSEVDGNNKQTTKVEVSEHLWGEFDGDNDVQQQLQPKGHHILDHDQKFDLIVGSDVAYRDELHDPLIQSLLHYSKNGHTMSIIGVTMNDTKPIFFKKLNEAGFVYQRIADHLLDTKFRGGTAFGIFIIQLKK